MARDPYQELGVSRTASADEIRKAFRKLAKQYHPDRNPGDRKAEDRFKRISAAFDLLGISAVGASDRRKWLRHAAWPADDPVGPEDIAATVYRALGVPADATLVDPQGRPQPVALGKPLARLFG